MFRAARFRLTFWYLVIIMMVSIIFSITIYQIQGREVERFARQRIIREQLQRYNGALPPFFSAEGMLPDLEQDLIRDAKTHIFVSLLIVNGIILVFSGGLSFFLAGKTLQPIQRMVDEQHRFISDASHELRTPLTALKTSLEVSLRDKALDLSGAKKIISESVLDVNQLQTLSENLLQLTQYQKSNHRLEFKLVAMNQVIREAVHKIEPLAKKKKINITLAASPFIVNGNVYSLIDLVLILLDNAVKYSRKGSQITVHLKQKDKNVILAVRDEGMGIGEKDLPHIFDRFYRADSARTKASGGGYGLGLSIAKKITEAHHGKIQVESTVGKGTVFTVSLPAAADKGSFSGMFQKHLL